MSHEQDGRQFLADVIAGLQSTPRSIPCKYLYDARGSALFDAICRTRDYYVTRADLALHDQHLPEICRLIGPQAHIIEFGSGSGIKTRRLLEHLQQPRAYTPIEISAAALEVSISQLQADLPHIEIQPAQVDYTEDIPDRHFRLDPPAQRRVVYFPGSTIGNFDEDDAITFLGRMRRIVGDEGGILIGVDLLKPESTLLRAYDDHEGITAQFNLNLLVRMRSELDARIDTNAFRHEAHFNHELSRVEMHLVASRQTRIEIGGQCFDFDAGEAIHTESSYKYTIEGFRALARKAGLESLAVWTDPNGLFSMHWLEKCEV
jgi:L-histidine Nalpha-methyltransferase